MRFSVIISTHNRPDVLKNAIRSVLEQSFRDFEVIVSEDASAVDARLTVESLKAQEKLVYLLNEERRGLAATRNAALKRIRGEFAVLIDDDITLPGDFLEILESIISREKVNVLCPLLLDPDTSKPFVEFLRNKKEKRLGFLDFNYFRGGAHIIRRSVFLKNGLYDEKFGIGARYRAAEETDYFFRLKQSGESILFCPGLVVYHKCQEETSSSKAFSYSYGIAAMLMKQISSDLRHFHLYVFLLSWRLTVSLIRTLQYFFFPKTIEAKNRIYRYSYFFKGTVAGILDYSRFH